MIYQIANPVDIDVPIHRLQNALYNKMKKVWGSNGTDLVDEEYDCYGRCYRNQTESGYVPELFIGGKDYADVFGSDKSSVQSFFGVSGRQDSVPGGFIQTEVHCIFFVDLSVIKAGITHRADAEARKDVFDFLRGERFGFTYKSTVFGIDEVFKEYPGKRRDGLKFADHHPYHYFRVNLNLMYNANGCLTGGISTIDK